MRRSAAAATATPAGTDSPAASAPSRIAAAAAALNPLASPKDEITASMEKFLALHSYHASMQVSGGPRGAITNEVDFVAPDRYRMQMPMGTQFIVGDTMYMDMQGKVLKVPMPKGTLGQWRDPVKLAENAATHDRRGAGQRGHRRRSRAQVPRPQHPAAAVRRDHVDRQ